MDSTEYNSEISKVITQLTAAIQNVGMVPPKYIYNNVGEIFETIKRIDSGEKIMDSDRWKLLKPEFR